MQANAQGGLLSAKAAFSGSSVGVGSAVMVQASWVPMLSTTPAVVVGFASFAALSSSCPSPSPAPAATVTLGGEQVLLAKPRVYMNECGANLGPLAKFYSIDAADVIALYDELDIEFGQVRLKHGGGEGGHNGLRSLSAALGTRDYSRVRLGIGRPPGRQDPAEFVLKPFPARDRDAVGLLVGNGADATELLLGQGLESAQNTVHAW